MKILETHIVPKLEKPVRIQEYLVGIFNTISTKSAIKKSIKKNRLKVDNQLISTATYINGNETITLDCIEEEHSTKRLDLKLEVVYEDDFLAIINKPAGILVSGNKFKTVANALSQNLKKSSQKDAIKPQPTHRLDFATSGLLLIGKTSSSILELNKLFENKKIQKTYLAVSIGKMESSGNVDLPVDKKESLSIYEVLETIPSKRFDFLNLVKLTPKTGRRHQLRIHLSEIRNPILGDEKYGIENLILKGKGLYLHASELKFEHPFLNKKMSINSKTPKKFTKIFH